MASKNNAAAVIMLAKAGYTKVEIAEMLGGTPDPAPAKKTDPEPAAKQESGNDEIMGMLKGIMDAVAAINISGSSQPGSKEDELDAVLASIVEGGGQ